jgi:MoaA/NifB/PqqE/SkfB family radical SAM enzyme
MKPEQEAARSGGDSGQGPEHRDGQHSFYGRLKAAFPSQIIVDATEVCNLACIHCPHPEFKRSDQYAARYLDEDLHRKLVDEVREYGAGNTQYIRYTSNGEPLVHPGIYDMLDYAVKHSGVFVTLTTNGTILNEKRVAKLLSSGLHMIDVSIDAVSAEAYSRVRVNGRLEVTRGNVLRLLQIRKESSAATRIVVSFVEQAENQDESAEFERYWKSQGVDYVVIRRLHSAAGGVAAVADRMRVDQARTPRYPCLYPWERILLNPRGELAFCPQDWTHGSVIGDYRQVSIREIWQGEFYRRLREAHLTGEFRDHRFCGQCPDWAQTRWPGSGRSYADLVEEIKNAPA